MPTRISAWLMTISVLFACAAQAGCSRKTSPEAASRAYAEGLTGVGLDGIWDYDAGYAAELSATLQSVPQSMWKDKTNALRAEWTRRIQNDRSPASPGTNECWQLFRPEAKADLLETRDNNQNGSAGSAWRSFVKVTFPVEKDAPIYFAGGGGRRLHEATVVMDISKSEPPDSAVRVNSTCEVIPDGLTVWPIPPLGKDQALAMFKEKSPDGDRPRVTLLTTWQVNFSDGFGGRRAADVAAASSLKTIFSKYGVQLQNVRDEHDVYSVGGMVMPASWSAYSLPSAYKNFDTPLPTYSLSESVSFSVGELQHRGDDQVVARVGIAYEGCTPICSLVKEINPIKSNNGDSAAMRVLLPPGRQDSGLEWPQQVSKEAYYHWNVIQGWQLTGIQQD
jgi:hypothetical protein